MDHGAHVLAAIVPDRADLLLTALIRLEPQHFPNEIQRNIFTMLERYHGIANGVMPPKILSDLLKREAVEPAKALLYEQTYATLAAARVEDHEFRYAIDALKSLRADRLTGEAITTAFEIKERGLEIDGEEHRGHEASREYLRAELARIDKIDGSDHAPEGDVRTEGDEIRAEYAARKAGETTSGILTGIAEIDGANDGFHNGELVLVAAYTSEGKSQFVSQTAWHAATQQGKNVFFATTETLRAQIRRRIIARHSRLPQFGYEGGLNASTIKTGTLDPEQEMVLEAVLDDLETNPDYGRLHITQVPRGGTLGFVEGRMLRAEQQWPIDLAVIDYLALLKPDARRKDTREEFNDLLRDAKTLAASFAQGRGVPLLSPWQTGREKWRTALEVGEYFLDAMSDTSEAEKSSDQIISLLRLPDAPDEARVKFLKTRDGETPPLQTLAIDYRNAYLGSRRAAQRDDINTLLDIG